MRLPRSLLVLLGLAVLACGTEQGNVVPVANPPGQPQQPGGRAGSYPLPRYWGAASRYAVRASITVTGATGATLIGGAFAASDQPNGQPYSALTPAIWVAHGDPISGIADGVYSHDMYAVFRPNDGILALRTLSVSDIDRDSYATFGTWSSGWGAHPDQMENFQLALSEVTEAGTASPDEAIHVDF